MYSKKAQIILDDVTSALDSRTMSAVVERVFGRSGIIRSKGMSAVVASHSVQILKLADRVLLMNKEGEIIDSGTYEQLAERHLTLAQRQISKSSEPSLETDPPSPPKEVVTSLGEYRKQLHTRVNDLRRQKGDWRSYAFYLGSMGWIGFSIFTAGALGYVAFNAIFGVWLTWWAEDTSGRHALGYWLGLYATWAVLIMLGMLIVPV